ncbi:MAG: ABC transporter permease [Defluviitaleaceae bacterium]|nr:ABC transporter permease [Defluviitaleaceae bacterium]
MKSHKTAKNVQMYIGAGIVLFFVLVAIFAPLIAPYDPLEVVIPRRLQAPSSEHWLGTDDLGRDNLSRIIFGARVSLTVGVLATAIGAATGVIFGMLAGYFGGKLDSIIMRMIDVLLAFPGLLLALAIVTVLGSSTRNVILAVAIFAVPGFARIVRGATLNVKKLEYIDAIRAVGANDFRIIFLHIFPNILSPIIVQATLNVGGAIVTAAALSFLGVGTPPPTAEWGAMVDRGRAFLYQAPHMIYFPGLMIFLLVVGINMFGDGLTDFLQPKKSR